MSIRFDYTVNWPVHVQVSPIIPAKAGIQKVRKVENTA